MDGARSSLAEAERQRKEVAAYGGLLVDGKIVEPPKPSSRESEHPEDEEVEMFETPPDVDPADAKEAFDLIQRTKNERYDQTSINTCWQLRKECWRCQQHRYAVIFYQRSTAHIWFNRVKGGPSDAQSAIQKDVA